MDTWDIRSLDVQPHSPQVLRSDKEARLIAIHLPAGEELQEHQVHERAYLLVAQGVHIGEFHFLEDLARDQAYEFCYMCATNKIKGTSAGFTLRPIAIR